MRATKPHQKSQSGIPSKYIVDVSTACVIFEKLLETKQESLGDHPRTTWGLLEDHFMVQVSIMSGFPILMMFCCVFVFL